MRKFWGYISNGEYSAGCTGRTVYLYDSSGNEAAKWGNISYGYNPVFCPNRNILVVKSTSAYFWVYSLDTLSLIKKVKFSKVDGSQDDGYCFSLDGRYFYNIERQENSTNSAISVYDTSDFERIRMFLDKDEKTEPAFIETDESGRLFVLGFLRGDSGVICSGFVSGFGEKGLEAIREIPVKEYDFYTNFKSLELKGFTDKAKEWSGFKYDKVDMTGMENKKYPLSELWEKYNTKLFRMKGTRQ